MKTKLIPVRKTFWGASRKMKVFLAFFLLLFVNHSMAFVSQERLDKTLVSVQLHGEPILNLFAKVEKQTDFLFVYTQSDLDLSKKISCNYSQAPLSGVLDASLEGMKLDYTLKGNNILLTTPRNEVGSSAKVAQDKKLKVKGKVTDKNGDPLIGVTIRLKNSSSLGTITDVDGNFVLNDVPHSSMMMISYVGYKSQTIKVVADVLNIELQENAQILDEVVVTALGIKRKEKALGYSVQKVNSEALANVKGVNVATSLTGKVAGLLVKNSSEMTENPSIQLRGGNPIVVIDGVAYGNISFNDLSAEDIESVDILKGATASALYGSRGRYGAIMVTTKKGSGEGKISIKASNNTMFTAGYLKKPYAQHSYSTGNFGVLEYNSGYVWGDYMDGREVEQYDPITKQIKKMPLLPRGANNVDNFFRPSIVSNTNVSISQSTDKGSFRVSATQVHHTGQYPNSLKDKYILSGNGSINYNKFKLTASFAYNKMQSPNMPRVDYGGGNILYNMLIWGGAEYDIRDFANYWKERNVSQNWAFAAWYDNPYFLMNERIDSRNNDLFNTSITMNYDFLSNLSLMFRSGYDSYINKSESRRSIGDSSSRRGYYGFSQNSGSSFNNDLILRGNYDWKKFSINAMVGVSSYWYHDYSQSSSTRGGISVPGFYSLNASIERPNTSKSEGEKVIYSAYAKLGLSWNDFAYLDVTGRNDRSSTLPADSRSYFYPSSSLSIIPTSLYNPIPEILDFWKVRGSWTVSKRDLGVYAINKQYSVSTDVWDGMSTASYPNSLRGKKVNAAADRSIEIGTDLRFFKSRVGLDITYFTRLQYDRLINAGITSASGFTNITTNTKEELEQRGLEVTLRGTPIRTSNFEWNSTFNFSYWHWYYAKLDEEYSSKDPRIKVGERTDKYFMYDWERDSEGNMVFQSGLPIRNNYTSVMGYADPKCILGFTNTFRYKNLSASISIDGRIGGLMYSWTEQALWHSGAHPDSDNKWRYDQVVNKKNNYIAQGVKVISGKLTTDPYGNVIEDTRKFAKNDVPVSYQSFIMKYNANPWDHDARQNIKDGSFIKLREVAINYDFPKSIVSTLKMKGLKIGFVGQNLLMWTKEFRFSDPDRGKENLNSPTSRYLGFNINVNL